MSIIEANNPPPQFVYAKFRDQKAVSRAVSALVSASIEPDEIDVLSERPGGTERVTMLHEQPIVKGALQGLFLGLIAGVILSAVMVDDAEPRRMLATLRWLSSATMLGTVAGAIAGMGLWRARPEVAREGAVHKETFVVGTNVAPARVPQIEQILQGCEPIDVGHRELGGGEAQRRRDEREVEPRL